VALDSMGASFLATGLAPGAIHRLAAIASGGLDSLPHASTIVVGLHAIKLDHKTAYKHIFWTCVVIPIIAGFFVAVLATMGVV
jgi:H+/gluconate symporter-like permease